MEFHDWINQKYIQWRGDTRGTISEFAEWVGVTQQVMSDWMSPTKKKKPGQKNLLLLVNRFGMEVYDILGLSRPVIPAYARAFMEVWHKLSNPAKRIILDTIRDDIKGDPDGATYLRDLEIALSKSES